MKVFFFFFFLSPYKTTWLIRASILPQTWEFIESSSGLLQKYLVQLEPLAPYTHRPASAYIDSPIHFVIASLAFWDADLSSLFFFSLHVPRDCRSWFKYASKFMTFISEVNALWIEHTGEHDRMFFSNKN